MLIPSIVVFIIRLTNIKCSEEAEEDAYKYEIRQKDFDYERYKEYGYDVDRTVDKFKHGGDINLLSAKRKEPGFELTSEEMRKFKIWPSGIVPYYIDDISFDRNFRERLRNLLNEFNEVTGVSFMELSAPPEDEKERWVLFINRRGVLTCGDYTTKNFTGSGVQRVVLGYDCLEAGGGALAGIVLAMVGVPPQHNSPDRDDHITVVMDNIIPEKRDLFKKLQNSDWLFHDVPYDFISASHYNLHQYSNNGSATIIPKKKSYIHYSIGERDGISPKDILKIKMLYNFISSNREKVNASDCFQIFKLASNVESLETRNYNTNRKKTMSPPKPSKHLTLLQGKWLGKRHPLKKVLLTNLLDFDTSQGY